MKIAALLMSFLIALPTCAATRVTTRSTPTIVRINFQTDVNSESVAMLGKIFETVRKDRPAAVLIVVNSNGGSVQAGWRIIRMIQNSTVPVHCIVDGEAGSMAFYILQACTTRGMTSTSKLLSHQPFFRLEAGPLTLNELRSLTNELQTLIDQAEILSATRMGMPLAEFQYRNQVDWWMSSIAALRMHAVDYSVTTVAAVQRSLELTGQIP